MQQSYTKNYLKIYLWQALSMVLNFVSMFIVMPYLTSNPTIYGIYTVCISVSIFLAYADLGFMSAGQKYAAEHFARAERDEEMKVIGFTSFILFVFLMLFSIIFFILSFHPVLLFSGFENSNQQRIASSLLFILACFTPITLFQRLLQMIFGIRLEDFFIQRTNIIANILKIISVLYFFSNGKYDVVGYFLFMQIVNLLSALVTLFVAKKRYQYNFITLFKAVRFSKALFLKTKNIAFASLFLTVSWVLYYELDTFIISKTLGASQVAIYALGLTLLSFFRSIFGILFSPFGARFNHFVGKYDINGLKSFALHIISLSAPVVIIPIICLVILAKPLIFSWVGVAYIQSVTITQFLILCNLFAFISYPVGMLLMAIEKKKEMYLISFILPIVFWIGIAFTYRFLGLKSFAVFKFIAFFSAILIYFLFLLKFLKIAFLKTINFIFKPIIIPVVFLILSSFIIRGYLPIEKSKTNMLIVATTIGVLITITLVIQYFSSKQWRNQIQKIINLYSV